MTAAALERERHVLDFDAVNPDTGETTAPLPALPPEPRPAHGRHRMGMVGGISVYAFGVPRPKKEMSANVALLWLAVAAALVSLLFGMAAGALSSDAPEPMRTPAIEVSTDSPNPTRPFVPAFVAGDVPVLGPFPIEVK